MLSKDMDNTEDQWDMDLCKGKKLPGHMGRITVTIQNLDVVRVDMDKNVLLIKGSVPGAKGAILKVKSTVKASK